MGPFSSTRLGASGSLLSGQSASSCELNECCRTARRREVLGPAAASAGAAVAREAATGKRMAEDLFVILRLDMRLTWSVGEPIVMQAAWTTPI